MNPAVSVMRRELVARPRRRRFYLKRSAFVALGGIVILWGIWIAHRTQTTTVGLMIFTSLTMSTLAAMCLISVATASSSIMQEKEERTLGLLFLTDISSWGFVFGKLFTSMFATLMTILSALPMFMLAVSLGGVSGGQILASFAVLVSTIFMGTCLGLFVSSAANTERVMNGLLGLICIGYFVLLPVVVSMGFVTKGHIPPEELMSVISPFVAMGNLVYGRMLATGLLNCCLSVSLGLAFLWSAHAILPRRVVSKGRLPVSQRLREKMKSVRRVRKFVLPARITGNPVTWKDLHFYHGGMKATWLKFFISVGVIALIIVLIGLKVERMSAKDMWETMLFVVLMFCAAVFGLGSLSHFGMTFNREKKSRAMEILLTTSLSDGEIVLGKMKAALLSLLPWLVGTVFFAVIVTAKFSHEHDFRNVASAITAEYMSMWFGYSCLAFWLSLRYKKNIAFGVCVLLFLMWNTFGRFMMLSSFLSNAEEMTIVALDVAVHMVLGVVCLSRVFRSLRRLALLDTD
jgi:ABC-type transport system involved in multi-copper enzyme maturation permease subunit